MTLLPYRFAKQHGVVIEKDDGTRANVSFLETTPARAISEVRRFAKKPLHCKLVASEPFTNMLSEVYEGESPTSTDLIANISDNPDLNELVNLLPEQEDLLDYQDDVPVIRLINALMMEAEVLGASDIHIETFEQQLVIRFRIDGVLQEVVRPNRSLSSLLVSRIKVMAKLDISEKRIPQDGHITLRIAGKELDVRVSTLPTNGGERVVLRLLEKQQKHLNLEHLGMGSAALEHFNAMLHKPHGIILVTGPTGSGKTTTLYACLSTLTNGERNIMTIEDPIEYTLDGIGQSEVNTKVDMTFARGLRAMLRQDPDVIMVGEIRDTETAEIAVQASLTGHLVFSTLHTNSAIGAVTRLYDMGIEPFLLSSSVIGLIAQRLVRQLCDTCKEGYVASEEEAQFLGAHKPPTLYKAVGCSACRDTGYKGRIGVFEVVAIDEHLRQLIHDNQSEQDMAAYAHSCFTTMRQDASAKVIQGLTTFDEAFRVVE